MPNKKTGTIFNNVDNAKYFSGVLKVLYFLIIVITTRKTENKIIKFETVSPLNRVL